MLIAFVVTVIVTACYLRDAHDTATALAHPTKYQVESDCPIVAVDTIDNFIIGTGDDVINDNRLRDSAGCVISQETVNFRYWNPIINHSEIIAKDGHKPAYGTGWGELWP